MARRQWMMPWMQERKPVPGKVKRVQFFLDEVVYSFNDMPNDACVVDVRLDAENMIVHLLVSSETFQAVPEGGTPPLHMYTVGGVVPPSYEGNKGNNREAKGQGWLSKLLLNRQPEAK